jgi:Fur family ferric uptake transcriptional regulator
VEASESSAVLPPPDTKSQRVRLDSIPRMPSGDQPVAPYAPACATFRSFLRRKGLKFTPERAVVLDVVLRQPALFDADAILGILQREGHRGSRATVYRTLGHLLEAGLLRAVNFGNNQGFYEVSVGGRQTPDYFIDVASGEIIPVNDERLQKLRDTICREMGFEPVRHQLHVFVRRKEAK